MNFGNLVVSLVFDLRDFEHSSFLAESGLRHYFTRTFFLRKVGNIEILTFHDRRFAFFKATARDRFELQYFLFGVLLLLFDRLWFLNGNGFFFGKITRGGGGGGGASSMIGPLPAT